jgi:hypothetical protein
MCSGAGAWPLEIGRDYPLALRRDDDDVEHVVSYAVRRR